LRRGRCAGFADARANASFRGAAAARSLAIWPIRRMRARPYG